MGTVLKYSVVDINSSLGVTLDGFLSVELPSYSDRVSVVNSVRLPTLSILLVVETVVELNVMLVVAIVVTSSATVEPFVAGVSVVANVVYFVVCLVVDVVVGGFSLMSLSISRADSVEVRWGPFLVSSRSFG